MKTSLNLDDYYETYSNIFQTYFGGYCKKTNEKLSAAKERYVEDINRMEEIRQVLPSIVEKVAAKGQSYFGFSLDIPIHLFVGLYASNAFVDHQAHMYLAIEKLPVDKELLEIIITHEMIHSYHYHVLGYEGIDWNAINWQDARNSMYLEGVATYLSQKLVPGHPKSRYFSYDYDGEKWLSYCKSNREKIASTLLNDLKRQTKNLEREWLRLSGGEHFGYNRLGYFLGTEFVTSLCKRIPEAKVLRLLASDEVSTEMDYWLKELVEKGT